MFPRYIHDPDFEADFIDYDDYYTDDVMSFPERFESLYCMSITALDSKTEFNEAYVGAYFRDLMDFIDDTEGENDEDHHHRKSLYLFFKSLVSPFGKRFIELHETFSQECVKRAKYNLEYIKEHYTSDNLWDNTRKVITDFLG